MYAFVAKKKKSNFIRPRLNRVVSRVAHCLFFFSLVVFFCPTIPSATKHTTPHPRVDWRVFYSTLVHYFRIADTRVRLNRFFFYRRKSGHRTSFQSKQIRIRRNAIPMTVQRYCVIELTRPLLTCIFILFDVDVNYNTCARIKQFRLE